MMAGLTATYDVEVDCPVCASKVEKAVNEMDGVSKAHLSYPDKVLTVIFETEDRGQIPEIERRIDSVAKSIESGWSMRPAGEKTVQPEGGEFNDAIHSAEAFMHRYSIETEHPEYAEKVELAINKIYGVKKAVVDFSSKSMYVEISGRNEGRYAEIERMMATRSSIIDDSWKMIQQGEPEVRDIPKITSQEAVPVRHEYKVHICCANCALKVENAINDMDEIAKAQLIYVDKRLIVEVTPEAENDYPKIEAQINKLGKKVEAAWEMQPYREETQTPEIQTTSEGNLIHEFGVEICCANCALKVEKAINDIEGITRAQLIYVDKKLRIEVTPEQEKQFSRTVDRIERAAKKIEADWKMWPLEGNTDGEQEENNSLIPRIAIGCCFLVFGLLLEYVFPGLEAYLGRYTLCVIFFIGLLVVGYDVIFNAFRNLKNARFLDENFLMMVATVGAIVVSAIGDDGYWTEAVAVMLFYQIGEFFEDRAVDKTRSSVKALVNLKAPYATVIRPEGTVQVKTETVKVGEKVVVKPGEMVPIDGVILSGESFMDTKAMTGEPVPRHATIGDEVFSGYINTESAITIKVLRPYKDSAAAKVLSLIEESATRKSSSEKFITKFARYYTPAVVICALALAVIPSIIWPANWSGYVMKGLIFLVVSCPCALVVSVPLSYFCGIGNASRKGILIKGSNYIEALSKVRSAVFDKTGTLTKGEFKVSKVEPSGMAEDELIHYAAMAEMYSTHPIAKSICRYGNIDTGTVKVESHNLSGKGVTSTVDGRSVSVGNASMMMDLGIKEVPIGDEAGTHVYVAIDGVYAGHMLISDGIKEDSPQAISNLKSIGVGTYMLTGDTENVGRDIASKLGLDSYDAGLLPQDKTTRLEEIMSSTAGSTAFIGDGINDAPSLTRADVGIAMGGLGSDAAVEAADVVIIDDKPSKVAESIRISKKTQTIVIQNIVFALAVKFIILGLTTATDLVNMWIAIFGDVGVLILAVLNSIRALGSIRRAGPQGPQTCEEGTGQIDTTCGTED